jgi:hypothetical protein
MTPGIIPGLIENNATSKEIIIRLLDNLATHPIKTAAGFRNAVMEGLFAINPIIDIDREATVNFLIDITRQTVREGRMIDFGFIPNTMLKETSLKTREVFEAGELTHPYGTWLGVSQWEGGYCGYLIASGNEEEDPDFKMLAVEYYGVAVPGLPLAVMINDICAIDTINRETLTQPINLVSHHLGGFREFTPVMRAANLLDPIVTFLRILSDASVPVMDVPAPERLNRQRAKHGREPIPPHTLVVTRDYVSAYNSAVSRIRSEGKGGHHESPVPHWRRAHKRHLASGSVIPVRSTKVNWRDSEELHRLFTRVKP